jgi:hypothetical protein
LYQVHEHLGAPRRARSKLARAMPPDAARQGEEIAGAEETVSEAVSTEVFRSYVCSSIPEGRGRDHPGEIAEAGSLRWGPNSCSFQSNSSFRERGEGFHQANPNPHEVPGPVAPAASTNVAGHILTRNSGREYGGVRSAIPLPKSDYPLWESLPKEVVNEGKLSR